MPAFTNIAELKRRASIVEIWLGLGGAPLIGRRGVAWWRGGGGLSVAVDPDKGVWFDHAAGVGGDALQLIRTVRGCSFQSALAWLSSFVGVPAPGQSPQQYRAPDTGWAADLEMASYWRVAAAAMAEQVLEDLSPFDAERDAHTRLLRIVRLGDLSLIETYREWRRRDPALTWAMVQAGRDSNARVQRQLMAWLLGRIPCLTDDR
jgi:hypothetical protein